MNSFDLFDTLIGRICGGAKELFQQMAIEIGEPDFPAKRIAAEKQLQIQKTEYSLEEIYKCYANLYGISYELANEYCNIEWKYEIANVFTIKKYAEKVMDGDIIVSDMYLHADRLQALLHTAGIFKKVTIYSSCYGKYDGTIWHKIPELKKITSHTGDHHINDVEKPRKYGVHTILANTNLSLAEQYYVNYAPQFAYWLRSQRLTHNITPDTNTRLHYLQLEYNIPFLWASSHALYTYFLRNNLTKLLFMSRDCQIFMDVFKKLYPEVPCEYVYISRDCLQSGSTSYFSYLNKRLTKTAALVDLSASGGSLRTACPYLKIENPNLWTAFFLKEPFKVDLGPIHMERIAINTETKCNNSHLERINYADHWHIIDVKPRGIPVYDQPGEYDMELVKKYHEFICKIIETIPIGSLTNAFPVVDYSLRKINEEGPYLKAIFPNHGRFEIARKQNIITKNSNVVIVSASWNYLWERIKPWYNSIRKSGFEGDVYMIDLGMDSETVNKAITAGIIVKSYPCTKRANIVERFNSLSALLLDLDPNTWAIFSDSDDLVFQRNPVDYLKTVPLYYNFVVSSEGVLFRDNSWTRENLISSFPEHYESLANVFFYNAGSIAGKAKVFAKLASKIVELCDTAAEGQKHDQAALNILIYSPEYKSQVLFTDLSDEWCFCGASSIFANPNNRRKYTGLPPRIIDGLCKSSKGYIPIMFHHYTRNTAIKEQVLKRYR
jgi:hypothetical protein